MSYTNTFHAQGVGFHHSRDDTAHNLQSEMHAHDGYEFYYFIDGEGAYLVESTAYTLEPGCVLLMRPGEVHRPKINPHGPYERIVVSFPEEAVPDSPFFRHLFTAFAVYPPGSGNLFRPTEYNAPFVRQVLDHMESVRFNGSLSAVETVVSSLPGILNELYRSMSQRQNEVAPLAEENRIREIIRYVNNHLFDELSVPFLCERFFISKAQFSRLFRAATGSTPWEYILVKRLIEARRRILSGTPANIAAGECGFQDYSAFFRAYKKRYGVSPTADKIAYRN